MARRLQRRRLSNRGGGGVLIWLLAFDTGRGYRRARIFGIHWPQGGTD